MFIFWLGLIYIFFIKIVFAGSTQVWELNTYEEFKKGELKKLSLSSLGEISLGQELKRYKIQADFIWTSIRMKDGTIFLGTGNQGKIFRFKKGLRLYAKTDKMVVTSLARDKRGVLYAATIPGATIFKIEPQGKIKKFVKLKAESVWSLVYDFQHKRLFAGTGPEGKIFEIKENGKNKLYYKARQKHVLCLALNSKGDLYAGMGEEAALLKIVGPHRGFTLVDFEAQELKTIRVIKDTIYMVVNKFPDFYKFTRTLTQKAKVTSKAGEGTVYKIKEHGPLEKVIKVPDGHITDIEITKDKTLWMAIGTQGRVLTKDKEGRVKTVIDIKERQVLTLNLLGNTKIIGTGDAGALYEFKKQRPKGAMYISKVLDTRFLSKWGNIFWRSKRLLTFQTRSGNTKVPDDTWTRWSKPMRSSPALIPHPPARYLQFRVLWDRDKRAILRAVTIYYLPFNQPPRLTEINIKPKLPSKKKSKGKSKTSTSPKTEKPPLSHSPIFIISWKTENPDNDPLKFWLYFREEDEIVWKPINEGKPILKTSYEWNTESVPDGNYLIQIKVSDETANPKEKSKQDKLVSKPFLIDNQKPRIIKLKVRYPYVIGLAVDNFSPISRIEYSIDGKPWRFIYPRDEIYDELEESFKFQITDSLKPTSHTITVRAFDRAGNQGSRYLTFYSK
jgi:hypothetical protein